MCNKQYNHDLIKQIDNEWFFFSFHLKDSVLRGSLVLVAAYLFLRLYFPSIRERERV